METEQKRYCCDEWEAEINKIKVVGDGPVLPFMFCPWCGQGKDDIVNEETRDAERYRWLRDKANEEWERVFDDAGRDVLQGDDLDSAIDAAMSSPNKVS